jgi:hypothetical protein
MTSITDNTYQARVGTSQNTFYNLSALKWPTVNQYNRLINNSSYMPAAHTPVMSNNSKFNSTKFDFF